MALYKCPECGKEVSNQTKSCPNCGYPLEYSCDSKVNLKKRLPVKNKKIIVSILVVGVIILVLSGLFFSFHENNVLPFNTTWGDSYEKVKKHDGDVAELTLTDSGLYVSRNEYDGSFYGFNKKDLDVLLVYSFSKNNHLNQILINCAITSESSITGQDVINEIIQIYSKRCKTNPYVRSDYEWQWTTENSSIELTYWSDEMITVVMEPNNEDFRS